VFTVNSINRSHIIKTIAALLLLLAPSILSFNTQEAFAVDYAPFTINVQPKKTTVKPGDFVTYHLSINADPGFDDPIDLTLQVSALVYSSTFEIGEQYPPYPKTFEYSIQIPEDVPTGITGKGVLVATSGEYVVEEEVEITLSADGGGGGGFIDQILQFLSDIWNSILSIFGLA
jgi:hypothetical protein